MRAYDVFCHKQFNVHNFSELICHLANIVNCRDTLFCVFVYAIFPLPVLLLVLIVCVSFFLEFLYLLYDCFGILLY